MMSFCLQDFMFFEQTGDNNQNATINGQKGDYNMQGRYYEDAKEIIFEYSRGVNQIL